MNVLLHNLTSHGHESSFDISRVLSRSLHKLNAETISKLLSRLIGNNLLGGQISLITNQKLHNILTGITVNFVKPGLHIVEGILISNVINDDNSMSTTVVAGSDSSESLLTSSIPLDISQPPRTKLQSEASQSFHQGQQCGSSTPSYTIGELYEIDTNGGNVAIRILVISETQQQTGLTDTRISNEEKLEKIVATHRVRTELSNTSQIHPTIQSSWIMDNGDISTQGKLHFTTTALENCTNTKPTKLDPNTSHTHKSPLTSFDIWEFNQK